MDSRKHLLLRPDFAHREMHAHLAFVCPPDAPHVEEAEAPASAGHLPQSCDPSLSFRSGASRTGPAFAGVSGNRPNLPPGRFSAFPRRRLR